MTTKSPANPKQAYRFNLLLHEAGLTQAGLAEEIKTSPNTVWRWASGRQKPMGIVWAYLELRAKVENLTK